MAKPKKPNPYAKKEITVFFRDLGHAETTIVKGRHHLITSSRPIRIPEG